MATAVLKEAGGSDVDITQLVQDASATHQWQRPSFATVRVPLDRVSGDWEAARLKIYADDEELDFHGKCIDVDDQADERSGYRVATFASPSEIFEFRPVRDADGDFSKPSIIADFVTGPQIAEEALTNSMVAGDPSIGEGPMGIVLGTFETGGPSMEGAPTDWPMTLSELFARLVSTGQCDIVERPIETGDNMAEVSAYNGGYPDTHDVSADVRFEFATGLYNARACQRERDYRELMNKLWKYGGPRVLSKADPAGDQHWDYNVTGTDPGLPDPPQSAIDAAISASRALHYERMVIDIEDATDDEGETLRNLTRLAWQMQTWMRVRGKTLISVTPDRGIAPAFRTGYKIHVAAGTSFAGGFSGTQVVQEYSYRFSARGPIELGPPIGKGMAGRPPVMTSMDGTLP
jgi:hypothetical protein